MTTKADQDKMDEIDRLSDEAKEQQAEAAQLLTRHGELTEQAAELMSQAVAIRFKADRCIDDARKNVAQVSQMVRELRGELLN